jgi:hypothetical protein
VFVVGRVEEVGVVGRRVECLGRWSEWMAWEGEGEGRQRSRIEIVVLMGVVIATSCQGQR